MTCVRLKFLFTHNFAILVYMKSLQLARPHLLIMTGIPGSGKTFFAEKFSETFNAPFISAHYLETITKHRQSAADATAYMLAEVMKSGTSALLETAADTRRERLELARFAKMKGYEPLFIWVQTDADTAKARAQKPRKNSTNRQLDASEHDRLAKRFTALGPEPHVVISGKHTYATQAKVVLTKLSAPRTERNTHSRPSERPETGERDTPNRRSISIG